MENLGEERPMDTGALASTLTRTAT